ncbi:MAG: long-chain fatty acid--CoA ligase [Frankiales bacterium]|nr:long-chain fatty acid--CoA ligase [Frankiales bacterium]
MLIDLLREGAAQAPDRPLVLSAAGALTYADALARAEAVARGLAQRDIERFGVAVADPGDLVVLLCAASAVGAEACMFRPSVEDALADELVEQFGQPVVITDQELRLTKADVLQVDDLPAEGDDPQRPAMAPLLVLTTGTTGRQKGARHDWSRLVKAARARASEPGARWLLVYNVNQFGGLQLVLHVLASAGTFVVPASTAPADAVHAMGRFEVTHASATPTFWRMALSVLDEGTAEALPLRQITLGGEASPGPLLQQLQRLFPKASISHVYAATEFGSGLSVRDGRPGLPLTLLDRDEDADVRFRVVDGELQANSAVGMLGYFGEPDFPGGWRPTGDLVEVVGDRILFVGRTSDTINVGGVKVHPLPVEELITGVPGVRLARVYGRDNAVTGQIVAIDVVPVEGADTAQIDRDIRAATAGLGPAARPRRIRFVEELELRGDKLVRTL